MLFLSQLGQQIKLKYTFSQCCCISSSTDFWVSNFFIFLISIVFSSFLITEIFLIAKTKLWSLIPVWITPESQTFSGVLVIVWSIRVEPLELIVTIDTIHIKI